MKGIFITLVLSLMLTACSRTPLEQWENFDETSQTAKTLNNQHSRVVFYREDDVKGGSVSIYANGHYQGTLVPNSKTYVDVCTTEAFFSGSFDNALVFGNRTKGMHYKSSTSLFTYVKVTQNEKNQLVLKTENPIVSDKVAKLPTAKQTHSRVKNASCRFGS